MGSKKLIGEKVGDVIWASIYFGKHKELQRPKQSPVLSVSDNKKDVSQ